MRSTAYLLSMAALALLAAGCGNKASAGGGGGGRVVATVNGENVTSEDMLRLLAAKPRVRVVITGEGTSVDQNGIAELPVSDNLAFQGLQDLVSQKLLLQEAKERELLPSDEDVEAEIKFRSALNPQFVQELQNQGFTMGQIRENILIELARERLLTSGVTVTMAQVDQYVKDNPTEFIEPATVAFDVIRVAGSKGRNDAQKELDAGASFEKVKEKYDQTPPDERRQINMMASGDGVPVDTISDLMRPHVDKTAIGAMTDWINAGDDYLRLKILKKKDKAPIEMTEERKKFLQRSMAMAEGSKGTDLRKMVEDKMREATIEVKDEGLQKLWALFSQRLKDRAAQAPAPAASTPEAGAPGQ